MPLDFEFAPVLRPVNAGTTRPPLDVYRFDQSHPRVSGGGHAHQDLEVLYFQAGDGSHRIGRDDLEISPGTLFLIPPRQVHDLTRIGSAQGWAVEFSPSAMAAVPEVAGTLPLWRAHPLLNAFLASEREPSVGQLFVPPARRPAFENLLNDMHAELQVRDAGYRVAVAAQVVILLVQVARLAADVTAEYRMHEDPEIVKCFDLIETHFRDPLSTTDIARAAHVSTTHLASVVKRRTGRTILDWLTERRMSEARQLLLSTDLSVETIGRRVGYRDPTYFSRRFRQLHGAPPKVWRDGAD